MRGAGALRVAGITLAGAGLLVAAVRLPAGELGVDLTSGAERTTAAQQPSTRALSSAALSCPGPETVGVRGSGAAAGPAAAALLTVAAAPTSALQDGVEHADAGRIATALLPASAATTEASETAASGPVTRAPTDPRRHTGTLREAAGVGVQATGGPAAALTADQTTLVTKGDLRGVTSLPCTAPAADTWLVGGGGEPGRRGRLVLTNPSANPVQVQVDVLAARGTVPRAAGSTVAVPGRARVVLLLDALAPDVVSPVVRVRTSGGAVSATLHDSRLAGTTPMGADDVAPAAAPATRVLVPGLTVNGRAMLRLGAPGAHEAVAQVRLLGPRGPVDPPGGAAVRVPAGGTKDVDLTALPAGTYGVEVRSDVPVVAGGMVERAGARGRGADLAWLAGVPPLRGTTGLPVVRATAPWSTTLELTAPGTAAAVDLVTVDARGRTTRRTLRVGAGRSTITVLPQAESIWLQPVAGAGEVVAARTSTVLVGADRLITAASLSALPTTEVVPVVRKAG